jgi:outer membrane immunogenic protein
MRKSFAGAAATLLACTALVAPAFAADRPLLVKAKPLPAPASWTQFYVGGGIGLNVQTGTSVFAGTGPGGGNVITADGLEGASLGLTATAGFDYQVSPLFVVGGFFDYDWSGQSTTFSASTSFESASVTTAKLSGGWTAGGRAGFLVTPNILAYGLGGFSQMRLENWSGSAFSLRFGPSTLTLQEPALTLNGYTLGGGVEYRLTNNVSLRGEYRYTKLGGATTVDPATGVIATVSPSIHIARVEAAYRFDSLGAAAPAAPARMPAAAWTGFYGGLGLGGDAISTRVSDVSSVGPVALSVDGFGGGDVTGTATVGADYQLQNWVAGVFASADFAGTGNAHLAVGGFFGSTGHVSAEAASIDNSWSAGGRLGYLIAPDALLYGLAGFTTTSFHSVSYNFGSSLSGTASPSDFHGITLGLGFEKLITDTLSARFEYRNTHYDTQTGFPATGFTSTEAQPTVNSVRVLVDYRFAAMK